MLPAGIRPAFRNLMIFRNIAVVDGQIRHITHINRQPTNRTRNTHCDVLRLDKRKVTEPTYQCEPLTITPNTPGSIWYAVSN